MNNKIKILVEDKLAEWILLAQSDHPTLLLRALQIAPRAVGKKQLQDIAVKIINRHAHYIKDLSEIMSPRWVDWTFLIKHLPVLQVNKISIDVFYSILNEETRVVNGLVPILFDTPTCRAGLLLISERIGKQLTFSNWFASLGAVMPAFDQTPNTLVDTDVILNIVRQNYQYIYDETFMAFFVDECAKGRVPGEWFFEFLPSLSSFRETTYQLIKFLDTFIRLDNFNKLLMLLHDDMLLFVGHVCLYNADKFRDFLWPKLCKRFCIDKKMSKDELAYTIYTLDATNRPVWQADENDICILSNIMLLALFVKANYNWASCPNTLKVFSDSEIAYILEKCDPKMLPVQFLNQNPKFVTYLKLSKQSDLAELCEIGLNHFTNNQLACISWDKHLERGNFPEEVYTRLSKYGKDIIPSSIFGAFNFFIESHHKSKIFVDIEPEQECVICAEFLKNMETTRLSCCKALIHTMCLLKVGKSCPFCRANI